MQKTITELTAELEALRKENEFIKIENETLRKICSDYLSIEEINSRLHPIPKQASQRKHSSLNLDQRVELFRSFFKGRNDVFAIRWSSIKSGKSGYQPVCLMERDYNLCPKRNNYKYKYSDCPNRKFASLGADEIYNHLMGKDKSGKDYVIGLYPLLEDNTCWFLCADFDDKSCEHGYQKDVLAFVGVCKEWGIVPSIERSRSGNGAHVWIFLQEPILASKMRKIGNSILTEAMRRNGSLGMNSYDRLFPTINIESSLVQNCRMTILSCLGVVRMP